LAFAKLTTGTEQIFIITSSRIKIIASHAKMIKQKISATFHIS